MKIMSDTKFLHNFIIKQYNRYIKGEILHKAVPNLLEPLHISISNETFTSIKYEKLLLLKFARYALRFSLMLIYSVHLLAIISTCS